ncbi:MAG: hypothetical protein JXB48_11025 [Candidatus Latescibacteria bacterium]|nr:hypothetical protein [Candidatus Latescibacterota bacterium]
MKTVMLLVVLLLIPSFTLAEYKALSRGERAAFLDAYQAVKIAAGERNYNAIIKFAPSLISKYESIMLDPSCRNIRPQFLDMGRILLQVRNLRAADSLEAVIAVKRGSGNTRELLKAYDSILPSLAYYDTSRYQAHLMYYNGLTVTISNENNVDSYAFLASLKFIDPAILDSYRVKVQKKFDVRLAQLSAIMNPDSILAFQASYPGIHKDDIDALFDRSRIAMRQSLLRQPSLSGYRDFKRVFGDDPKLKEKMSGYVFQQALSTIPDPVPIKEFTLLFPEESAQIWNQYEDSLFARWSSRRNQINTRAYMRLFPQGRYAAIIQEHFQSIQSFSAYTPDYFDQVVGP